MAMVMVIERLDGSLLAVIEEPPCKHLEAILALLAHASPNRATPTFWSSGDFKLPGGCYIAALVQ